MIHLSDTGGSVRQHELTDFEWRVIEPLLPNKLRGVLRVNGRRVLDGILWRFRTGSPDVSGVLDQAH
jgi:hypothetical protein